jgi:hypothetical protein
MSYTGRTCKLQVTQVTPAVKRAPWSAVRALLASVRGDTVFTEDDGMESVAPRSQLHCLWSWKVMQRLHPSHCMSLPPTETMHWTQASM